MNSIEPARDDASFSCSSSIFFCSSGAIPIVSLIHSRNDSSLAVIWALVSEKSSARRPICHDKTNPSRMTTPTNKMRGKKEAQPRPIPILSSRTLTLTSSMANSPASTKGIRNGERCGEINGGNEETDDNYNIRGLRRDFNLHTKRQSYFPVA